MRSATALIGQVETTLALPQSSRYGRLSILVVDPANVNGAFEVECGQLVGEPVPNATTKATVPARVYLSPLIDAWHRHWRLKSGSPVDIRASIPSSIKLTLSELVLAAVDSLQRLIDVAQRLAGSDVPARLPRFKPKSSQHSSVARPPRL